jgi:hypothetical protein
MTKTSDSAGVRSDEHQDKTRTSLNKQSVQISQHQMRRALEQNTHVLWTSKVSIRWRGIETKHVRAANKQSQSVSDEGDIETKHVQSVDNQSAVRLGQRQIEWTSRQSTDGLWTSKTWDMVSIKIKRDSNKARTPCERAKCSNQSASSQHQMKRASKQNTYVLWTIKASDSVSIRWRDIETKHVQAVNEQHMRHGQHQII